MTTSTTPTPETEGRGIETQGTRKLSAVDFLRLLGRQCQAVIDDINVDNKEKDGYRQIFTWLRLWLTDDAEERQKTHAAKRLAEEAILNDTRRQFDNADDLIRHIHAMTREKPSYTMEDAMWVSVHLFCDDWLNKKKESKMTEGKTLPLKDFLKFMSENPGESLRVGEGIINNPEEIVEVKMSRSQYPLKKE